MDEVAATIEGISIATAADEAVGFIEGAAEVVSAIPFDLLPEGARAEASSALAPLKQIDFDDDVAQPLGQTMSEVLAEVEGPTLDDIIQAFAQVTAFLAEIDPRPGLAEIEREGFGAFRRSGTGDRPGRHPRAGAGGAEWRERPEGSAQACGRGVSPGCWPGSTNSTRPRCSTRLRPTLTRPGPRSRPRSSSTAGVPRSPPPPTGYTRSSAWCT